MQWRIQDCEKGGPEIPKFRQAWKSRSAGGGGGGGDSDTFPPPLIFFWRHLHYWLGEKKMGGKKKKRKKSAEKGGGGPRPIRPPWIRHCQWMHVNFLPFFRDKD